MIFAPLALITALAPKPENCLDYGTEWHCASSLQEHFQAEFRIEDTDRGKKLVIIKSSLVALREGTSGYGATHADKNNLYDESTASKDPFYPYAAFLDGFYDSGVEILGKWSSLEDDVELSVRTFDWENRNDPKRRNEQRFLFACRPKIG